MSKQLSISSSEEGQTAGQLFDLKHMAFLLKLLRIFIMAAFSTSEDSSVYDAASLVRRSSSIQEDSATTADTAVVETQNTEGSRFKQLQNLMEGPIGVHIIE